MLESLTSHSFDSSSPMVAGQPAIGIDGRISVPGFPAGLSIEEYLPLMHLYTNIIEASRLLDRYRSSLRLLNQPVLQHAPNASPAVFTGDGKAAQAPLTNLSPSTLIPHLYYKREDQTVTKAYKVRGAVVGMSKMMDSQGVQRFVSVSTGNHALGVLKAAELLRPLSVRLVVPTNTAPVKLEKLKLTINGLNAKGIQADLIFKGDTFDEARNWACQHLEAGEGYLDPFGDSWVVAGQGTLGLELLNQIQQLVAVHAYEEVLLIAPIGGGGLLTGTATALKMGAAWETALRNVKFRFIGLRLSDLSSQLGDAIRVTTMAPQNVSLMKTLDVSIQTVTDDAMRTGIHFVRRDLSHLVEGASGATLSPVLSLEESCQPSGKRLVVSLLSGANCLSE
jgi:threonine dehydratase